MKASCGRDTKLVDSDGYSPGKEERKSFLQCCSQVSIRPSKEQGWEPWKCCWNAVLSQPGVWDIVVHSQSSVKGGLVSWQ